MTAVAAVAALPSTSTVAQTPTGVIVSITYDSAELSAEFLDLVARYGAGPSSKVIEGKPLAAYVEDLCGSTSADNLDVFERRIVYQGWNLLEDGSIASPTGSTELSFPPCLPEPITELTPRIAFKDTTFYQYFRTDQAGASLFGSDTLVQKSPSEVVGTDAVPIALPSIGIDVNDPSQLQTYFDAEVPKWLANSKSSDAAAFDAFLAANDLVRNGSDPLIVSTAMAGSFATAGQTTLAEQLEVVMPETLKRYSAVPSEQWASIVSQPIAESAPSFTDQIQWLDFDPQARPGQDLLPGHIALVPSYKSQTVDFVLDPALLPTTASDPVEFIRQQVASLDDEVPAEILLLENQGVSAVEDSRCEEAQYESWQSEAFVETFGNAITRSRLLGHRAGMVNSDAQIVVVDSGFVQAREMGAFGRGILSETGARLDAEEASPLLGERRAHGTAVAGVAIGGPGLWGLTQALGLDIGITPRGVYNEYVAATAEVALVVDWNRVDRAIESDGDIYNISFATTNKRQMGQFERFLGPYVQKLFVVAAGNNNMNYDSEGVDLSVTNLYPQLFSDESSAPNLITVAAYDGVGRAWFSNFSEDYVAIAAPGCAIASWVPDADGEEYVETEFAGTSFAAPIVSYVAAIVRALMPADHQAPFWVRSRILASADLIEGLDGVTDGRLLNPVKAVSVYEDFIELEDGSTLTGQLGTIDVRALCDLPGLASDAVLLKFARLPEPRNGKDSVVYYLRNRELQRVDCNHRADGNLGLSTESGNVALAVRRIHDIVLKVP